MLLLLLFVFIPPPLIFWLFYSLGEKRDRRLIWLSVPAAIAIDLLFLWTSLISSDPAAVYISFYIIVFHAVLLIIVSAIYALRNKKSGNSRRTGRRPFKRNEKKSSRRSPLRAARSRRSRLRIPRCRNIPPVTAKSMTGTCCPK